jgi:hypothetical protein
MPILVMSSSARYVGDYRRARDYVSNAVEGVSGLDGEGLTWVLM